MAEKNRNLNIGFGIRLKQVADRYGISLEWLVTGHGPMFLGSPVDEAMSTCTTLMVQLARLRSEDPSNG